MTTTLPPVTVEMGYELRPDGSVWQQVTGHDGRTRYGRVYCFPDTERLCCSPQWISNDGDAPTRHADRDSTSTRDPGTPLPGARWATHDDIRPTYHPSEPCTADGLLVDDFPVAFAAVSCSTESERVFLDLGYHDQPDMPVTVLTMSMDTDKAIDAYRQLAGALRYLGVDTDALYPGHDVAMTHRTK
ncbi:hypothetical protein [Kutzneria kofuensis]|uniref:Uncharacterized protein n=1 Tax=Kutzneria kofuensis TaxID=103725 RepID=A0A7W9NGE5_9PSEU|nr:hypothetical protein [Kutzneria kofuensis]MBB5891008.1 hypothetical protein [Kutzneria kofuensis]